MALEALRSTYDKPSSFGIASTSALALDEASEHGLLDPLSRALLEELTTRRDRLAAARLEVAFWSSPRGKELEKKYFSEPTGGESSRAAGKAAASGRESARLQDLEEQLEDAKRRLEQALEREAVKKAILRHADDQHAVIASFSSSPFEEHALPDPQETADKPLHKKKAVGSGADRLAQLKRKGADSPADDAVAAGAPESENSASSHLDAQRMRSLVGARDTLSLELLHRHAEATAVQQDTHALHTETLAKRVELALLLERLRVLHAELAEQRRKLEADPLGKGGDGAAANLASEASGAGTADSGGAAAKRAAAGRSRIGQLKDALREVREKSEMVKGVLRGIILEGGLDWARDPELLKLMLLIGDEKVDSDEDIGLSDEEDEDDDKDAGKAPAA